MLSCAMAVVVVPCSHVHVDSGRKFKPKCTMTVLYVCRCRLLAVVGLVRDKLHETHVVVVAVLPRGSRRKGTKAEMWPNQFTKVSGSPVPGESMLCQLALSSVSWIKTRFPRKKS